MLTEAASESDEFLKAPILVGGTGRSGTTVVGRLLAASPNSVMPVPEIKIAQEPMGLVGLYDGFCRSFDSRSTHYAIANFASWARFLRRAGFSNELANRIYSRLGPRHLAERGWPLERFARSLHVMSVSGYGIGNVLGSKVYDEAVATLLDAVVMSCDPQGPFDTEGVIRPFYEARDLSPGDILTLGRSFLGTILAPSMRSCGASVWVDTTPKNIEQAGFMSQLLPQATFVHSIRDPIDVVQSLKRHGWSSDDFSILVKRLAVSYRRIAMVEEDLPRDKIVVVRLEDLVDQPSREIARLCAFLKLDVGSVESAGRRFLHPERVTYPRLTGGEMELVNQALGSTRERYGYV